MSFSKKKHARCLLELIMVAPLAVSIAAQPVRADDDVTGAAVRIVSSSELPNLPGMTLTAVTVSFAPGGKSAKHHHAGSVFAYVVSGSIRSENSATGPARVYSTGESFFEPPGSTHLVTENASDRNPAVLLAIFIAENGAKLTTVDK